MRGQAGEPEPSPQQQNDNQSSPQRARHVYSPDGIFVARRRPGGCRGGVSPTPEGQTMLSRLPGKTYPQRRPGDTALASPKKERKQTERCKSIRRKVRADWSAERGAANGLERVGIIAVQDGM